MSQQVFFLDSKRPIYESSSTIGIPGTGYIYDNKIDPPIPSGRLANNFAGTISYSGEITRQLFG